MAEQYDNDDSYDDDEEEFPVIIYEGRPIVYGAVLMSTSSTYYPERASPPYHPNDDEINLDNFLGH
jgi:hypothetical protein